MNLSAKQLSTLYPLAAYSELLAMDYLSWSCRIACRESIRRKSGNLWKRMAFDLPADINVLLALAWSNHPHHDAAHDWFARESAGGWATCLLTQTGFLRLSLNPQIVGVPVDCQAAVNLLENLVSHPDHQYIQGLPTLTASPFDQLVPQIVGYRQVSDATLLHVARFHGLKLVTFDQPIASICPWSENLEILTP